MQEGLRALARDFSALVSNVRGAGLLLAIDLPDGDTRAKVRQACWDRGLAVLPCGPRSIRFRPPLIFTEAEAEGALGTLRQVLGEVA